MKKRLITLFLSLAMVLSMIPVGSLVSADVGELFQQAPEGGKFSGFGLL